MIDEQKLLEAVIARRERHGNTIVTLELLESIVREASNPTEFSSKPPSPPPQLYVPPEFPKRKIRLNEDKQIVEERIVHTHAEETELRKSGGAWTPPECGP
jgi:hypothetical protein